MNSTVSELVEQVGAVLHSRGLTVATAESCTGGLVAKLLTDRAGSSTYFVEGIVAYANAAKVRRLGVAAALLAEHGAVSRAVAAAMAAGCRTQADTDFAVSLTGIAGPGGGTPAKPVGLVYIGIADAESVDVHEFRDDPAASRCAIRDRAAQAALGHLLNRCRG